MGETLASVCAPQRWRWLVGLVLVALFWGCGSDGNDDAAARSEDVCASPAVAGYGFDTYGGWKGISRPPAARFRVEQIDGVWWLLTPAGHGLFSNGPTGIDPVGDYIRDSNRSPHLEAILAKHGTLAAWADATVARLCDLGIRSHGGWLSTADAEYFSGRIPYALNTGFYSALPVVVGAPASTRARTDVFAPEAEALTQQVALAPNSVVRHCANDPWCIGVFVDNELPWAPSLLAGGSHLDVYLAQAANAPGKRALQAFFERRYGGDLAAFNTTWGTQWQSFDELQQASELGSCAPVNGFIDDLCALREGVQRFEDRMQFEAAVAGRLAELADAALAAVDPLLMNLGPRITAEPAHPAVVQALAAPVDVMSINNYDISAAAGLLLPPAVQQQMAERGLLPLDVVARLQRVAELTGKPLLVSEWFFRVARPDVESYPPVLPEVESQQAQADSYRAYMDALLSMPFVVGEHWFQWVDQPIEGRFDGENQLIGIVDIGDELNQPLADSVAATNATILSRRLSLRAR